MYRSSLVRAVATQHLGRSSRLFRSSSIVTAIRDSQTPTTTAITTNHYHFRVASFSTSKFPKTDTSTGRPTIIEDQIQQALLAWETARNERANPGEKQDKKGFGIEPVQWKEGIGPMPEKLAQEIRKGNVPPIYHARLMPLPCQALASSSLSDAEVEQGPNPNENNVLDLGIRGSALSDSVDSDTGYPKYKLVDDADFPKQVWRYSPDDARVAVDLVNAIATMIGRGVEETKLTGLFKIDRDAEKRADDIFLLTRPQSRGVTADCFGNQYESAIIGSPGIGKSWTLLYALQQALLYDNANVILYNCKESKAFLFLRRNNKIYAWSSRHIKTEPAGGPLFDRADVLVLYDPPEVENGGAQFDLGMCQLIVAMSANTGHGLKAAVKSAARVRRYIAPPSKEELKVMAPRLTTDDWSTIEDRIDAVGRLPRYIRLEDSFEERKIDFNIALEKIRKDKELLYQCLVQRGESIKTNKLPGTLFYPYGERHSADGSDNGSTDHYDGKDINYQERFVSVVNDHVLSGIVAVGSEYLVSYWGLVGSAAFAEMGKVLEKMVLDVLCHGEHMFSMKRSKLVSSKAERDSLDTTDKLVFQAAPEVQHVTLASELGPVFEAPNTVARLKQGFPGIDAAGPGMRLYQITVSDTHELTYKTISSLFREAEFLHFDKNGMLKQCKDMGDRKIEFYWVVPPGRFSEWKNKGPKQFELEKGKNRMTKEEKEVRTKAEANLKVFKNFWKLHVDEYALEFSLEGWGEVKYTRETTLSGIGPSPSLEE